MGFDLKGTPSDVLKVAADRKDLPVAPPTPVPVMKEGPTEGSTPVAKDAALPGA
jgi:hypothetical protein